MDNNYNNPNDQHKDQPEEEFEDESQYEPEVERGLSAVAATPGKNIAVIAVMVILIGVAVYYGFFSKTEEEKIEEQKKKVVSEVSPNVKTAKPVSPDVEVQIPAVPSLPEPPPLVAPTPPPPPAPVQAPSMPTASPSPAAPVPAPALSLLEDKGSATEEANRKAALEARKKSSIMLGGGGGGSSGGGSIFGGKGGKGKGKGDENTDNTDDEDSDDNSVNFTPDKTSADQQRATFVTNDTGYVIAQGKIIDAILETAINTDLPGQLRAIVSRDIYAESGRMILIPKGSRLIGSYQASVIRGQSRVDVIWNRVIRPDGIDVMIDSPATDQLGRSGIEGDVNNRYMELFGTSILLSTITTGFAIAADNMSNSSGTSTSTTTGSSGTTTTTNATAADTAITSAVQNLGSVAKDISGDFLKTKPTITVDQGERIKVFVNRDLIFPANLMQGVRVVQ